MASSDHEVLTSPEQSDFSDPEPISTLSSAVSIAQASDHIPSIPKRKKSKKKSRKRRNSSPDGSQPRRKSKSSRTAHAVSDSEESGSIAGFVSTSDQKSAQMIPPWLNCNVPPGPWQMMGAWQYPPMWQPYPMPDGSEADQMSDLGDMPNEQTDKDSGNAQATGKENAGPLPIAVSGVSMSKHLEAMPNDTDQGPCVEASVAETVERAWNRTHKDELKELYLNNKRPGNTPSLQKVTLDEDLAAGISEKFPRAKRADAIMNSVNTAMVKTAICITKVLDLNMTNLPSKETAQAVNDKATEALKMLAYGTSQLHHARRDHIKNYLDPTVRQQITRNKALTDTNTSHQLFGGDIHKQAKDGKHLFIMQFLN